MHRNAYYQTSKVSIQKCVGIILLTIMTLSFISYGCGGGVVPYVPTQSGASGAASTGQFFLMEKGVAIDMFDVKKLQPLFRNIVLSGNERNKHKSLKQLNKKEENNRNITDSTTVSYDKKPLPVLNLHRLH
jgi:hypothetical protein